MRAVPSNRIDNCQQKNIEKAAKKTRARSSWVSGLLLLSWSAGITLQRVIMDSHRWPARRPPGPQSQAGATSLVSWVLRPPSTPTNQLLGSLALQYADVHWGTIQPQMVSATLMNPLYTIHYSFCSREAWLINKQYITTEGKTDHAKHRRHEIKLELGKC